MKIRISLLSLLSILLSARPVVALEELTFPSCTNPEASIRVSYESGMHAIVGENSLRQGRDTVYNLGNGDYLQCFCPEEGTGIKTSWMQVSQLDDPDINLYIKQGWVFISDGKGWGLDNTAYLAKNETYSCSAAVSPTPGQSSSGGVGGQITEEAASTSSPVLGLANTGTEKTLVILLVSGTVMLILGKKVLA